MNNRTVVVHGVTYRIERQIGHGLHSLVYSGQSASDGRPVAIKITNFQHGSYDVKARTASRRQSFWKEIEMLLYLQPLNPYVIRVINYDFSESYGIIVMERGKTFRDTLVEYMFGRTQMSPSLIKKYWSQMADAIAHMHRLGIVHGDIKPENFIQVGRDGSKLRLIDMGISFQLPPNVTSRLKTASGTPDYVSPEMVNTRVAGSPYSKCGYKADVWALGVILFEMAYGYRPLQALRGNDAKLSFLGRLRRDLTIPEHPDAQLRDLLKGCLRWNPRKRLSIEQVLEHPYLRRRIWENLLPSIF